MSACDAPSGEISTPETSIILAALTELEQMVVTDPSRAVTTAMDAMEAIDRNGGMEDRLRLRRMLAMAYTHTNQFEQALEMHDAALRLPDAATAPIELARVQLASMQPLAILGRIDEAIDAGQTALHTLEASHDGGALAGRAALNIGSIHAMTGQFGDALPWFDRARDHLGDEQVLLGQIETNRGTALAALDRFQEAEEAFERAVSLLDTDEMSWAAAIAEGNLADLAARQGAMNRSLRHFEASRRYLERDNALGQLGRLNAEEAALLAAMGLTSVARDAFAQAIDILRDHGAPADLAMAQVAYGQALVDAGAVDAAATVLAKTSALIDQDQHADLYAQFAALRARIEIARGRLDDAAPLIETGLRSVAGLPIQRLRWSTMEAACARLQGDGDAAQEILSAALQTAEQARITPLVADLHQELAGLARVSGQTEAADVHARQAIDAIERIRGTIQADRLRQSWHHGHLTVYGDLYQSLLNKDDQAAQDEAFGVAERIRSRKLLDAMHVDVAEVDPAEPVPTTEQPLVDELDAHRRWLNWMYSSIADGQEPEQGQLDELRERERAATQLADRLATLRPQSRITTPVSLSQAQARLDETTAILSYLNVGDELTLQIITRASAHGVSGIAPATSITEMVGHLQFQIGRALVHGATLASPTRQARLQRDTDAVLERLHDLLIAPAGRWLDGIERVIVVPSGDVHSVPFAALRTDGGYLIDRFEVVTTPSASVLASMREDGTGSTFQPERPLVAGVPDETAPDLGEEARMVARRFATVTLLLDGDATWEAVLAAMPTADLIHLACHGRFDSAHPTASGLRLADGWLTLDRLAELQLDGPLLLLTGCETGRVRVGAGDDLEGMMAAMIAAGARGLVTSLWKTHDAAAAALMTAFYDALEEQVDPVTALCRAQQSVRAVFGHPAMWAPFVAVHTGRKGA